MAHDELDGRPRGLTAGNRRRARPERDGHGRRHPLGFGDAGQLDQPGAVSVLFAQHGGRLHRQTGLARAARADQRHESVSVDRLEQLFQLGFAADEPAQLRSQVAGCRRPGRRPQRGGSAGSGRVSAGSWARTRACSSRKARPGSMPSSSTNRSRASV